jgi:5'-3' exonuclease
VTPPKIRDALREAADRVLMNEELARLHTDLDLGDGPLAAPVDERSFANLRALFEILEFKSLAARLSALEASSR